jgi:hypothetical protein
MAQPLLLSLLLRRRKPTMVLMMACQQALRLSKLKLKLSLTTMPQRRR